MDVLSVTSTYTERDKDILSVTWTYWAWHGSTERDLDLLYVTWTYWAWHGLNGRDMDLPSGTWTYCAFIAGTRNFISQETGNFFTDFRDPRKLYFLSKIKKGKGKRGHVLWVSALLLALISWLLAFQACVYIQRSTRHYCVDCSFFLRRPGTHYKLPLVGCRTMYITKPICIPITVGNRTNCFPRSDGG